MINNNKWFSIIIWMGLVVLITLSAYVILDYMLPYVKNTKWIENASNAYYNAYWWIELALEHIKTRPNLTTETWWTINNSNWTIWKSYSTSSSWMQIPKPWEWNSEYDKDFNTISRYEPIQLEVWKNAISTLTLDYKIPAFTWWTLTISWTTTPILWWILSWEGDTLIASWSYITASNINSPTNFTMFNKIWLTLLWSWKTFQEFYWVNCWTNSWCILKISVINKLELTNWNIIPYLEYKITPSWNLPDRYTTITSWGKSYMYKKDLKVKIPQQTVNQALDFTVFQ